MRGLDLWAEFRIGPQRLVEMALIRLRRSPLTPEQKGALEELAGNYQSLLQISEHLAAEVAAAGEEMARIVRKELVDSRRSVQDHTSLVGSRSRRKCWR